MNLAAGAFFLAGRRTDGRLLSGFGTGIPAIEAIQPQMEAGLLLTYFASVHSNSIGLDIWMPPFRLCAMILTLANGGKARSGSTHLK